MVVMVVVAAAADVNMLIRFKLSFQNHEEGCPNKVVKCPSEHCNVKLARRLIEEHLLTSCPWRIVCCPFCSESHPKSQEHVRRFQFLINRLLNLTMNAALLILTLFKK